MNNFQDCCESLIRSGFGTLEMSAQMLRNRNRMIECYTGIDESTKRQYSFPRDTDGFLAFGSEHAAVQYQPDLCERFCYWRRHAAYREHAFRKSDFVAAAAAYEAEISQMAQLLLNAVAAEFGAEPIPAVRSSSYLQMCVYAKTLPRKNRQFAQDPHEDGHLLSFIKPNKDGLVLVRGRSLEPVRLLENELAVLSGSLLTRLSDSAIAAAYHAVLTPPEAVERMSLIYFANPNPEHALKGFRNGLPVDLLPAMNERHTAFGNPTLEVAA